MEAMPVTPSVTQVPAAGPQAALYRWRWWAFAVVLAADVMDLLDAVVTNIAAPSVRADLGGGSATLQWLGAAYSLPFAVLLITGGRLGDLVGRRRLFLIGAAGFTLASALCALAPSVPVLLTGRVVQGAFGALMIPQGFGVMKEIFDEKGLAKAFAAFGPVMGLSAVAGPILGGTLVDADLFGTGWRMIFLINLPVGLLTVAGAAAFMPRTGGTRTERLDPIGVLLVTLASLAVVYPLVQGRELGWPVWTFAMLAAGIALFGAFALRDRGRPEALIAPALLRNRSYVGGIAVMLAFFGAVTGLSLTLSLFCQLGLGFSPTRTALALAPMSVGMTLAFPATFALLPRFGRRVIHAGLLATALGTGLLAAMVAGAGGATSVWTLLPGAAIAGFGSGLAMAPLFDAVLSGVGGSEVGSASGVLNAVQQLANAIGVALVPTVLLGLLEGGSAPAPAMARTALVSIALAGVAFALAFRLPVVIRQPLEH
jgi:EmrB/QacA subfamily drug resistance transporter